MPLSCEYMHRVWRKADVEVFPLIQPTLQLYCKLLSEKMNEKIFMSRILQKIDNKLNLDGFSSGSGCLG